MLSFLEVLGIVNGSAALGLGIFTLVANFKNRTYRAFGILAILLGIWPLVNALPLPDNLAQPIALAAICLAAAANLHFVQKLIVNKSISLALIQSKNLFCNGFFNIPIFILQIGVRRHAHDFAIFGIHQN